MKYSLILVSTLIFPFFSFNGFVDTPAKTPAKVYQIKKLTGAFLLKAVKVQGEDSILIISYCHDAVDNKIDSNNAKKLHIDGVYKFVLYRPSQYRTENLTNALLVVVGKDTIWRGFDTNKAPFFALNCRGLLISE